MSRARWCAERPVRPPPSPPWPELRESTMDLEGIDPVAVDAALMSTVALGWHDDTRMADDYKLVLEFVTIEKP